MGLILFWVYDKSAGQNRTMLLYEKTLKMILVTLKIAGFRCCDRYIGWRGNCWRWCMGISLMERTL